jgi:DNA-binding CsgD family transcriptional regulator
VVAGGPRVRPDEWHQALSEGRFTGEASLMHADGREIGVQFAGSTEIVTGHRLVLSVALTTSRWGARFRRAGEAARGKLPGREREIVQRVALGETSAEIAAELGISEQTVKTHVRNAMSKLGARSRAHLRGEGARGRSVGALKRRQSAQAWTGMPWVPVASGQFVGRETGIGIDPANVDARLERIPLRTQHPLGAVVNRSSVWCDR